MVKYIGSCSDDSVGIGYVLTGSKVRYLTELGFQIQVDDGDWISCYDVVELKDGEIIPVHKVSE